MSFTSASITRARAGLAALGLVALFGLVMLVATASAAPSYNDADLEIRGGDARAFALCVNSAKTKAKVIKRTGHDFEQRNRCENIADALGGDVNLDKVDVEVKQRGDRKHGGNSLDLTIAGGDAVAVAACVNVAQGTYDTKQVNDCLNSSVATGGSVNLNHVDITIHQS